MKKTTLLSGFLIAVLALSPLALHEQEKKGRAIASVNSGEPSAELTQGFFPRDLRESAVFGNDDDVHLYFNIPPYTNPGGIGLVPAMIDHINKAKVSIRMAIFQFNHQGVFEALKKAVKERGVKVYIATDKCYSTKLGYKEFFDDLAATMNASGQDAAKQLVDDDTPSCDGDFNHNKYAIFDYERGEDAISWMGSYNPTNHGSVENVELAVAVKGSRMANILNLDHEQLMNKITKVKKKAILQVDDKPTALSDAELTALTAKTKSVIDYPKAKFADKNGDITFEVIVAPKVKSISRIIEEVYDAKEEIVFSSFAISDPMLISALINKFSSNSSDTGYNEHTISLLSHPWEKSGIILRLDGERGAANSKLLWEWSSTEKAPSAKALATLQPLAQDLKNSIAAWNNYVGPSGNFKSMFRYFYPKGSTGGKVKKVHVEGIFNNKVIGEENTLQRLKNAGIPIWRSQMNGELHNKLFIIDEKTVIFGSHNFSQAAETQNDELTIIIKSPGLAKILRDEYYSKTKHFAQGPAPTLDYSKATVAITEILPSSAYKVKQKVKTIDMGSYVELFNYGSENINLYGFRLDDRYFPAEKNLVPELTSNPGFSADLVAFDPAAKTGDIGRPIYDPKRTILKPGQFALVVGRYFHPSYYKNAFVKNFTAINKRAPKAEEFPLLLTVGAYYQLVIGDAAQGIKSKDKIALYGPDYYTLIDRYDYPADLHYGGQAAFKDYFSASVSGVPVERLTTADKLLDLAEQRNFNTQHLAYRLKNATADLFFDYLGASGPYSRVEDWAIVPAAQGGTPGTLLPSSIKEVIPLNDRVPEVLGNLHVGYKAEPPKRFPANTARYSLEGRIVDVEKNEIKKGVVVINGEKIEAIYFDKIPSDVPAPLFKDLIIYPGLIDTHNHIKYNNFPLWKTPKDVYQNRYDWPNEKSYGSGMKEMYKRLYTEQAQCEGISNAEEKMKCQALGKCLIIRYGELKGLAGGTTTIQGSSSFDENTSDISFKGLTPYFIGTPGKKTLSLARKAENALDACLKGGGRNLEREVWNGHDIMRTTAQPITGSFWPGAAPKLLKEMNNKDTKDNFSEETHTFFVHLGEGQDQGSKDEFNVLEKLGLERGESAVIHGTAFGPSEFAKMAKAQMPLLWSPTSNLLLYKKTTDVVSALKAGVVVALGSDWALSGSKSLLGELKVVDWYNKNKLKNALSNHQLMKMVTSDAAKASHLDKYLGTVSAGKLADLVIFKDSAPKTNAADFLVGAYDKDVFLTLVGGKPLYGEEEAVHDLTEVTEHTQIFSLVPAGTCGSKNFVFALDYADEYASFDKLRDTLNSKTADAFKALTPKMQVALGDAFKQLDPLCEFNDKRYQTLIEEMKIKLAK